MAKFTDVNFLQTFGTANTASQVFFRLKAVLKAAGWTVSSSSDGTTYNASGDQITHAGTGAGGMENASAWYVVREPGGRREWCIQHTTAMLYRCKYSALTRFGAGSPSATRVPAATDEQTIAGSGSDATPTGGSFFNSSTARLHIIANSNPIAGCYPFVFFMTVSPGTTEFSGALWQEPVAPGSFDVLDADPCIVGAGLSGGGIAGFTSSASKTWIAYGLGPANFATIASAVNATFNGALAPDLASGKDINGRPLFTCSVLSLTRVKGYGATIAIKGPARAYPATANRAIDAYVYLNNLVIPYADNTEPGV